MKATKYIFGWHHWCGLIVGLFLLMMSVTGSLLVFSDELEVIEERNHPVVQEINGQPSFDASFYAVQKMYPQWEIRLYHLPRAGEALVYDLRQKEKSKKLFVHPVTGQLLGVNQNANSSLQRSLLLLHYTWFSGTTGKIMVFITGVLFLITLITGIIVYRKSVLRVLRFRVRLNRRTTRSFYSSLHRIIGVWSLAFNVLIVSTGLWLSGQIALTALKSKPVIEKSKPKLPISSIDAVVTKIQTTFPDFQVKLVRVRPGGNAVQVTGRLVSDPFYYGNYYSGFTVNGQTLEIESSSFMKELPTGEKLKKMSGPLHFGNYGGMPVKILYCLLGLTPAFLSISGFILWRKKKKRKTVRITNPS